VEAMALPHKTAPYPNLSKVVTFPQRKDVQTTDDSGGERRKRRRS
jgi:uncharacterized 2Fe-2S/4Fe-4S cluster protein (DUF4445 family)